MRIRLRMNETEERAMRRRNRAFAKLTPSQKRVQIARDVIAALKSEQIVARSVYLGFDPEGYEEVTRACDSKVETEAAHILGQVQCQVCGIGSLFVAAVKRADDLKFNQFFWEDTRGSEVEYLSKFFDKETLDSIELFYERQGYDHRHNRWGAKYTAWVILGSPIRNELNNNRRMEMIMENIISNRGKFDPMKGKHATPRPS